MMEIQLKINGITIGVAHVTNIGQYGPSKEAVYSVKYARIDNEFYKELELAHDRDDGAEALAALVLSKIIE